MHILNPVEITRKLDHAVHAKIKTFKAAVQAMAAFAHFAGEWSPGCRTGKAESMLEFPSKKASKGAPVVPDSEGSLMLVVRISM